MISFLFTDVTIVPSTSWDENGKELLGVSIRFCNIKESCEYVWHILVSNLFGMVIISCYLTINRKYFQIHQQQKQDYNHLMIILLVQLI